MSGTFPNAAARVARIFGLSSPERELELAGILDRLSYEDFEVAKTWEIMLTTLESSLTAVQDALGGSREMDASNIATAGKVLEEHAAAYKPLHEKARAATAEINDLVKQLE